ncbi:hypothetical protein LOTGIDRAFT_119787, partial [Lottia gigantea]
IPIDNTVKPFVQQFRHEGFNLRPNLEKKLDELENVDLLEKVKGSRPWISLCVVVPKDNSDIRL